MKNDDEVRELVLRLLVSPSLGDMLGYLIPTGYGYMQSTESVLSRMGLVVSLVSHGILDDGDPGIGWVRYGILVDSDDLYVECQEGDDGAMPYVHKCQETAPAGTKHLYEKEALWMLDWWDTYRRGKLALMDDYLGEEGGSRESKKAIFLAMRTLSEALRDGTRMEIDARLTPIPGDVVDNREVLSVNGDRIRYLPPSRGYEVRSSVTTWANQMVLAPVQTVAQVADENHTSSDG